MLRNTSGIAKTLFRTFAICLALGTQAYAQSFLTDGLVTYYPFNGNANDESGLGNHGTVNGAILTTDRFGVSGKAMSFNGINQFIQAPHQSYLNFPSGDFTMSFWASLNDTSKTQFLMGKDMGPGGFPKWILMYGQPPGYTTPLGFSFHINVPPNEGGWYAPSDTRLKSGVWQHVLVRKTSSQYDFFIDGAHISTGTGLSTLPQNNTAPLTIGWTEGPGAFLDGKLDDIRIYDRAFSAQDVAALYAYESVLHPCIPHAARVTATVVNSFVVGATITDGGCGYTEPPRVVIRGIGTGATATATIENGVVTGINILNAGLGYSANTEIKVASPRFGPWLEIAVSKVMVTLHVELARNYVILSSADLQTWTQVGAKFTAQDEVIYQDFAVTETGRYFRIQEVP